MATQFREETGADSDFITAGAKRHVDNTHAERIKAAVSMSKVCHGSKGIAKLPLCAHRGFMADPVKVTGNILRSIVALLEGRFPVRQKPFPFEHPSPWLHRQRTRCPRWARPVLSANQVHSPGYNYKRRGRAGRLPNCRNASRGVFCGATIRQKSFREWSALPPRVATRSARQGHRLWDPAGPPGQYGATRIAPPRRDWLLRRLDETKVCAWPP